MSVDQLETGDMMVVTVRVPTTSPEALSITVIGSAVKVFGPDDFRHEVTMANADLDRLHVQLYRGILELRAPHTVEPAKPPVARAVAVEPLN